MESGRRVVIASALALVLPAAASADTVVVNAFNFDFSANPQGQAILDPTINVGDTIRWVVTGGVHATQSLEGATGEVWISPNLSVGQFFEHRFTTAGVYPYLCRLHARDNGDGTYLGMGGTITVVPTPGAAGVMVIAGLMAATRRRRGALGVCGD